MSLSIDAAHDHIAVAPRRRPPLARSLLPPVRRRRRKFPNEISPVGLERVRDLLGSAAEQHRVPTQLLLRAAGLQNDPRTGLGALKMAEVLGLVHSERGDRKALLWSGRSGSPRNGGTQLWNRLPFQRLRDLLQYYRGSLIGTPDLIRDAALPNGHEALGALKALVVLGYVEIGHLDIQTIAWRWVTGSGPRRTYQRGYFEREETPVPLDEGPRDEATGTPRWPWLDELEYHEWLERDTSDGFESIAAHDGLNRYRAPTPDDWLLTGLVNSALAAMPRLQRAATVLVTLNGLSENEAAAALGVARSTLHRLAHAGLVELQGALIAAGYGPTPTPRGGEQARVEQLAEAA